ncbi:hypothetical protein B0H12DRAFT_421106 [Mycena haematopus]|nr:hypothetical protein B0H12DRAFT_421106 [Mycena haematopus]
MSHSSVGPARLKGLRRVSAPQLKLPSVTTQRMEKNELREAAPASSLEEMKLGVWRVLTEKEIQTSAGFATRWKKITALLPTIQRFVTDVYTVGPGLLLLIVLSRVWSAVEDVLLLHLATKVLSIIEVGLREREPDTEAIVNAVVARILVVAISAAVQWWRSRATPIMENRCFHYFEDLIFSCMSSGGYFVSVLTIEQRIYAQICPQFTTITPIIRSLRTLFGTTSLISWMWPSQASRQLAC